MDHRNAVFECVQRTVQADINTAQFEGAGVGRINARNNFHESGFTRAILTHKGVNRTALEAKLNIIQRHNAGKFLAHILDFENVFRTWDSAALADNFHCRRTNHACLPTVCKLTVLPKRPRFKYRN